MLNSSLSNYNLQYIVDGFGKTSAVMIPYNEWLIIRERLNIEEIKEPSKEEILQGIKSAVSEVRLHLQGKKNLKTLDELIDEL